MLSLFLNLVERFGGSFAHAKRRKSTSRSARPPRRGLRVEGLESRLVPTRFLWVAGVANLNWSTPGNWYDLDAGAPSANNYPGDTAGRFDNAYFDPLRQAGQRLGSALGCTFDVGPAESLKEFSVQNYMSRIEFMADMTVTEVFDYRPISDSGSILELKGPQPRTIRVTPPNNATATATISAGHIYVNLNLGPRVTTTLKSVAEKSFGTVSNEGMLTWEDGKLTLWSDFTNRGEGCFVVATTGPSVIDKGFNTNPTFVNLGCLQVRPDNNNVLDVKPNFQNEGVFWIETRVVKLHGTAEQKTSNQAVTDLNANANLWVMASDYKLKSGRITGSGTIVATVDQTGGQVFPSAGLQQPGTLKFNAYKQAAGAELLIFVSPFGVSKLEVAGDVALDGTITFWRLPGYTPGATVAPVVTWNTRSSANYTWRSSPANDSWTRLNDPNVYAYRAPYTHVTVPKQLNMWIAPVATIKGRGWLDTNRDGLQSPGELGRANVVVSLLDSLNNHVVSTTTDTNGDYAFYGVASGGYFVRFDQEAGHQFTLRDHGDDALDSDVNLAGESALIAFFQDGPDVITDAGYVTSEPPPPPPPGGGTGMISDRVWLDADADGIQDVGESGLFGVVIRLLDGTGNVLATTTSDAWGFYNFSGVSAGTYALEFVAPIGYAFSAKDQGGYDAHDSDADPLTGRTDYFSLLAGEWRTDLDAGFHSV